MTTTLTKAVRTVVEYRRTEGAIWLDLDLPAWSATYGNCGTEAVKTAFEVELSRISLLPDNVCHEGK